MIESKLDDGTLLPIESLFPARIRDLDQSALCLGYGNRRDRLLVLRAGDEFNGVFLDGKYAFNSFHVDSSLSWTSLIVPGIRFEVDPTSAFDLRSEWAPLGALLIGSRGARLQTQTQGGHGFTENIEIPLGVDVRSVVGDLDVGFRRWALLRGEGREATKLLGFEITAAASPH